MLGAKVALIFRLISGQANKERKNLERSVPEDGHGPREGQEAAALLRAPASNRRTIVLPGATNLIPLPFHKVGVTVLQRSNLCLSLAGMRLVKLSHFFQKQGKRPIVRNNMVYSNVQQVIILSSCIKTGAK